MELSGLQRGHVQNAIHQNHLQPLLKPIRDDTAQEFQDVGKEGAAAQPRYAEDLAARFGDGMMLAQAVCEQMGLDAEALDQRDRLQEAVERFIIATVQDAPCPMDAEGRKLFEDLR